MLDLYNRKINYLRISVTDRCNLRCRYCMPEEGVCMVKHSDILTYEEIQQVVAVAVPLGIDKIRLTGGEPLVRKDIVELVRMIADVNGVKDIAITTNGILLENFAKPLADAGLHRVNVSLDTMNPEKFYQITRGGDIRKVFAGIEAARLAGLSPIKVNCVVKQSSDEPDALAVKQYCRENGLLARFISQMDLSTGHFGIVDGGTGGDCSHCNRLRLTPTGKMKPCLFSDLEYDIREMGIQKAIEAALFAKPEKGTVNLNNCFHNIGG
ncbi:MAG: radical SAM protein [Bacteroidales bacterium]|nr:radical SAM protein [Bacteroidales bacterium]